MRNGLAMAAVAVAFSFTACNTQNAATEQAPPEKIPVTVADVVPVQFATTPEEKEQQE